MKADTQGSGDPMSGGSATIHGTAVIEPGARLGQGVSVGPFAYVDTDVEIGDGCVIGPHVSILRGTALGARCRVHAGAVLGDLPQDLGFGGGDTRVRIGAGCVIREGVTVHRGTKPGTVTEIGEGCFLMAFSHFAHNVKLGKGVIVANGALLAGYVEVGEKAFISGNVVIHQFVKIGRLAMLGGNAGISKDVPPFCLARPVALNTIAGLNVVGLKRAGLGPAERAEVKKAFQLLYRSGLNITQAVAEIRRTFTGGPALEFVTFIENSKRGICGLGGDDEAEKDE